MSHAMNDHQLVRKLILIVLIKLTLLSAIWWLFFRQERVTIGPGEMDRAIQTEQHQPTTGETRNGH